MNRLFKRTERVLYGAFKCDISHICHPVPDRLVENGAFIHMGLMLANRHITESTKACNMPDTHLNNYHLKTIKLYFSYVTAPVTSIVSESVRLLLESVPSAFIVIVVLLKEGFRLQSNST